MPRGMPSGASFSFGPNRVTPVIKALIAANVAAYLLTFLSPDAVIATFGLTPRVVIHDGYVWQLVTYLFLHSPASVWHILFNMLALWMFAVELEERWGPARFSPTTSSPASAPASARCSWRCCPSPARASPTGFLGLAAWRSPTLLSYQAWCDRVPRRHFGWQLRFA